MNTSGHGHDALLILVPIGVLLVFGIILFGGPAETIEAVNAFVGYTARATMQALSALFS